MSTPRDIFLERKKWAGFALTSSRATAASAEIKVQECRDAFKAVVGTPAEAECAAALADMETSLAAIKFKEKTEEMRDKGKNAVNAFKRAREIEGQRKFYAEAKAIFLAFEADGNLKASPPYQAFFSEWKTIETTDANIDPSMPAAPVDTAAVDLAAAKERFADRKKWALAALTSSRASVAAAEPKVQEVRDVFAKIKGTVAEAEYAAALSGLEQSLSALKIKEQAAELDHKGRGAVQAFKRARDDGQKRKHFADAKAAFDAFEASGDLKAQPVYKNFINEWQEIVNQNPDGGAVPAAAAAPTSGAPTAPAAKPAAPKAADPSAAKAHFDDRKKWTLMALSSSRTSAVEAERKVQEVRDAFAALKGTPSEGECSAALAAMEEQLSALKLRDQADELGSKGSQTVNAFKRLTAERPPPSLESGEADIKRKFQWYEEAKQLAAKVSADAGLKAHPAVVKFLDDWKSIENTDMKAWEAKARALLSGVKSEEQIRDEINNLSKAGMIKNGWKNTKVSLKIAYPDGRTVSTTVNSNTTSYGQWSGAVSLTVTGVGAPRTIAVAANQGVVIGEKGEISLVMD